jgi:threonyl-tRNA synthetase
VIGDREISSGVVALRLRDGRQVGGIGLPRLISEISQQVSDRSLKLGFMG